MTEEQLKALLGDNSALERLYQDSKLLDDALRNGTVSDALGELGVPKGEDDVNDDPGSSEQRSGNGAGEERGGHDTQVRPVTTR